MSTPTNHEHTGILLQGVESWNQWRNDNPQVVPNFSGAELFGAQLNNANFRDAVFIGADLRQANLYGADLSGAQLDRARLNQADLREADLYGAHLVETDLSQANLSKTDLRKADLRQALLVRTVLSQADLSEAVLSQAVLNGALLRYADLSGAILYRAVLRETNLIGAHLRGARLRGADLYQADLYGADLSSAHLDEVDLSHALLSPAALRRNAAHLLLTARIERLTPQFLGTTLTHFLTALAELQKVIGDILEQPSREIEIYSINHNSLINISLDGAAAAISLATELIMPWKRKHSTQLTRLAECATQVADSVKQAARAERERKTPPEIEQCHAVAEKHRRAHRQAAAAVQRAKNHLALKIVKLLAPDLSEEDKIAYIVRLLPPLEELIGSELEILQSLPLGSLPAETEAAPEPQRMKAGSPR